MNKETEKKEARRIYEEYTVREASKLDELKALDKKVKTPPLIFALVFGIIGALVLGVGMCLSMKIIGDLMIPGIVIGIFGIAMVIANYFLYCVFLSSRKKNYADKVMALSNDLLNN